MSAPTLLPSRWPVALDYVTSTTDTILLLVTTTQAEPPCPDCGQPASRVHSHYERTVADLPWQSTPVRLRLRSRRLFCDRPECERAIFTERFPGLVPRYGRRTLRLRETLLLLGTALGGEAASRLAHPLGMPVSPDTLLDNLRDSAPAGSPSRVLGVDDFAFTRGQRYGTLLVDLETHAPVDLLADRAAATLAAWLGEHPGAQILSRDRSGSYAEGARQGAPDAVQVADRWHLLKNLTDALGEVLAREHAALREAAELAPTATGNAGLPPPACAPPAPPVEAPPTWDRRSRREREQSAQARARRLALYEQMLTGQEEGLSARQIARRLGISKTTVTKYLKAGAFVERKTRASPLGSVEPHAAYLRRRWEEGCHNAKQLWRELREQGFPGEAIAVWRYTRRWWDRPAASRENARGRDPSVPAQPAPRAVVWWLLCPQKRTKAQSAFVERLKERSERVRRAHALVAEFFGLVSRREAAGLEAWMWRAEASGVRELASFCQGVRRDWKAVVAGLSLEWSNGPVEGHINRLKLIKRQMYGRAGFALLRARVLRPS